MSQKDTEKSIRAKAQNDEYSLSTQVMGVSGVNIEVEIEGNELVAERLWIQITNQISDFTNQYENAEDVLEEQFGDIEQNDTAHSEGQ